MSHNPTYIDMLNMTPDLKERGLVVYKYDGPVELPFSSGLLLCPLCHEHFVQGEMAMCFLAHPKYEGQGELKLFVHKLCYRRLRSKINKIERRRAKLRNRILKGCE